MRRGRWVVYCGVVATFLFFVQTTWAITLSMSATVPLSRQWKDALRINSTAQIDASHPHILLVSQQSLGIDNIGVENQKIQLLVFKNNVLVDEQIKETDKRGFADFVFVAQQPDDYVVIVVNKSDVSPFIVKIAKTSL